MVITRTAAALLAAVCVAAGAGGTFWVLRNDGPPAEATVSAAPAYPAVAESEGVIAEEAPAIIPVPPTPEPPRPSPTRSQQTRVPERQQARLPRVDELPPVPRPVVTQNDHEAIPIEPAPISDNQASRWVEPPRPVYEELVVSADSVIGLQLESSVTSDRARVEDSVVARVTRDVRVGSRVAIPSGSRAFGEVTLVERGGKLRDRARLGVRFTSIVLADGTRLPIQTETVYREGDSPGRESATKIGGGAIGGAIIGGILGGAKGAAIGGSIGAGAGTAAVVAGDRNQATLAAGSPVTVRLEEPVVITVER